MNKKVKKILAGAAGFILIIGLLLFANSLVGNPVCKLIAGNTIKEYVSKNYSEMNLELGKVGYNFKFGGYGVMAQSATSKDTVFYIYTDMLGGNIRDDYEYEVANCFTTLRRLSEEMDAKAEAVMKPLGYDFDYMSIRFLEDDKHGDILDKLRLDMMLDISNPPGPLEADVCIFTEDMSWDKIAEVALAVREAVEANNIPIEAYSVRLIPLSDKTEENQATTWINAIAVTSFPAEQMDAEHLAQVMAQYPE